MPLRPAREGDLAEICALIHELAEYEQLRHEVRMDPEVLRVHLFGPDPVAQVTLATVVEPDGSDSTISDSTGEEVVVGFALWFRTFSTFLGQPGIWLEDLFVRPAHRKKGYGAALLRDLRGRTDGRVEWAVLDWNRAAIDFYDALGARPVDGWTIYRWLPG
jgi:hypothetical protein